MERGFRHEPAGMKRLPFVVLVAASAQGQTPPPSEPEVRRALPANVSLENYDNPDWVQRVRPAEAAVPTPTPEVRPALPARDLAPEPGMAPFRPTNRAAEDPQPVATPAIPETTPAAPPPPQPDEAGSIRIAPQAPSDPARAALELANSLYARKIYDMAIPEYERFLIGNVREGRDAALFRLAECHRNLGNGAAARAGYEKLVFEFTSGEFAGAGAYRLGEVLFAERIYDAAVLQFGTAAREAKDPEVRLTARYFAARSLDYLKRNSEAVAAYREVAEAEGKNPYRDHARFALAEISLREGRKEEALAAFEEIARGEGGNATEAAVKAASLAAEAGDRTKALALFELARKGPGAEEWLPLILIGEMRLRYQGGDHKGVAAMGAEAIDKMPAGSRAEALQILAASQRQLGNNLEARRTYDRLIAEYPDAAPAADARLQRLASLYALNDKNLLAEIDTFLAQSTDEKARAQATLLKAEMLYKERKFEEAGAAYTALADSPHLDASVQADILYKLGWCKAAAGHPAEAATAYTIFLERYPAHALAASALARRGLARQEAKDLAGALEDFQTVSTKYPGTPEHELSLLQRSLIAGQQKDFDAMTKGFSELLEKFPKTGAAAQANFWLGWAAFEQKDYTAAVPKLEAARQLDAAQYGDRATLRIILAHYYAQDRPAVVRESAKYTAGNLPAEIVLWLADSYFREGDFAKAEAQLAPLAANPASIPPDALIQLAEARIRLKRFTEAKAPTEQFLRTARDPATRARGLLASARIAAGLRQSEEAARLLDETMLLQPEGRLNAEARIASGDLLMAKSDFDGAARAYMTVSVLTDDAELTPQALKKASEAYRKANNPFEAEKALTELRQRYPDFDKPAKPKNT